MRLSLFPLLATVVCAKKVIEATALIPCSEDSQIVASKFDIVFNADTHELDYDLSLQVQVDGYLYANIVVYAYGFQILERTVNPCSDSSDLKQLCPFTSGTIVIDSTATLGSDVISDIPGIAFTFPNIDAFAIVKVYRVDDNTEVTCIRVELSNTKTVSQTSVRWVTAVIAGIGLFVSSILTFFGSGWTAQRIGATAGLMFSYFQSVVIVNMEAVDRVPPMASGWADNLSWSVGMVKATFMQKIFRWYVQATGGSPDTYMLYDTVSTLVQKHKKRALDALEAMVPPRVAEFIQYQYDSGAEFLDSVLLDVPSSFETFSKGASTLAKRENALAEETYAASSSVLLVIRGIKRVAWNAGIEATSAVLTSFTIFVFVCVCVGVIFAGVSFAVWLMTRNQRQAPLEPIDEKKSRPNNALYYRGLLPSILKGTILNLVLIAFPSIMVFSLWEFVQQDSAAVIVLAVIFLLLTLAIIGWNTYKMVMIAWRSKREMGTPAFLLYSDATTMHRYGFLYQRFHAEYYWFAPLYLAYHFVIAVFIAFAQSSGKVQGIALFVIELALLILVCIYKPFMDKSTNLINIAMQVIKTINALFFLFYSNLLTQPIAVNAIMGVLHFIINAAFSFILLMYILVYCALQFWRKNPDAHQDPAKDDRLSFISDEGLISRPRNNELVALGAAAQADHEALERPTWFTNEDGNPFENGQLLPHPPSPGLREEFRHSRQLSERSNTIASIPDLDSVSAGVGSPGGMRRDSSGLLTSHNNDSGVSGLSSKSSKKKKFMFF